MSIEFDVKLSENDLYRFNLRQSYLSTQGPISIIIAILFAVVSVVTLRGGNYFYGVVYIVAALLFLFYIPITLRLRAKRTLGKNPVMAEGFHYQISEEEIRVTAGEQSDAMDWQNVYKMVATKHQVLIFTNRIVAFIIPREQLGDKYDALRDLASGKLEKYRFKMK